jgi:hypothetical protein
MKILQEFLIKPYSMDNDRLYIKVYAESIDVLLNKAEKGDIIIPTDIKIIYDEKKVILVEK